MKRNIILMGGKTHVISLPLKWVKKYGIKKGEELEILEQDNQLTVFANNPPVGKKIKLNLENSNIALIVRNISNCYQLGYSEIELLFDKKSLNEKSGKTQTSLSIIQDTCDQLIGFEILDQKDTYCKIKDIAGNDINEFKNILRRLFLMLNSFGTDTLKNINKTRQLSELHRKHIAIRKYVSYCQRYLNIKGLQDKTSQYNELVIRLLDTSRVYRFIAKNQSTKKNKYSKEVLDIFNETISLQKDFYNLFYKFSNSKASELTQKRVDIFKKINKLNLGKEDLILLHRLTPILNTILSLTSLSISINFEN